jgi:hypothetical protein
LLFHPEELIWHKGELIAPIFPRILDAHEDSDRRILSGRRDLKFGTDFKLATFMGTPQIRAPHDVWRCRIGAAGGIDPNPAPDRVIQCSGRMEHQPDDVSPISDPRCGWHLLVQPSHERAIRSKESGRAQWRVASSPINGADADLTSLNESLPAVQALAEAAVLQQLIGILLAYVAKAALPGDRRRLEKQYA